MQGLGQLADQRYVVRHVGVRDLLATLDAQRRSDRLAKLNDKLSGGNIARRKAMPGRHRATQLFAGR